MPAGHAPGLADAQADGGGSQQSTVVMVNPSIDGGSFEARYANAVDVTPAADAGQLNPAPEPPNS